MVVRARTVAIFFIEVGKNRMNKGFVSALYTVNIIAQAIFTLLTPAAIFFAVAFLLVEYASAPEWSYAVAIVIGILIGFYSMIKFIISAMKNLERLEEQRKNNNGKEKQNEK